MSRSRPPKCPVGRARCWVCMESKQVHRRLREQERGERDLKDGLVEVAHWPREVSDRFETLAIAGEPYRP